MRYRAAAATTLRFVNKQSALGWSPHGVRETRSSVGSGQEEIPQPSKEPCPTGTAGRRAVPSRRRLAAERWTAERGRRMPELVAIQESGWSRPRGTVFTRSSRGEAKPPSGACLGSGGFLATFRTTFLAGLAPVAGWRMTERLDRIDSALVGESLGRGT
jgi:hypothetical protein